MIINCLPNWEHILIIILLGSNLCRSHAGHGYLNAFAWPVYLPNIPHTANNFIYKKFVFLDTFIMFLCYVIVFSGIVLKTYVYCTSGGSFMSKAELCLMSFLYIPRKRIFLSYQYIISIYVSYVSTISHGLSHWIEISKTLIILETEIFHSLLTLITLCK